jgi:hypothetical protein
MTEAVGAIEQQPVLFFRGQPISAEGAAAQRAELTSNPDYVKAALAGDAEKQSELAELWQLSRGLQPGADALPSQPQDAADVMAQMDEKELARAQQRVTTYRNLVAPETDLEASQFEKGEATKSQKEAARRNLARAIRDPAFAAKVGRNDMDALRQWSRWNWIAHSAREIAG